MRIIKKLHDIELLKRGQAVDKDILSEMEENFKNIYRNLGEPEGIDIEDFSLKDCGLIVYLEAGDNIKDLEEIGLNPEEDGLLGATPEWVDEQKLKECILITTTIVYNNEYVLSIFFERGKFGKELENWIEENM